MGNRPKEDHQKSHPQYSGHPSLPAVDPVVAVDGERDHRDDENENPYGNADRRNRKVHGIGLDYELCREKPEIQNDRGQEDEHRAVEAELPSTLNHLGNPELWTLNSVEAHERKADESPRHNRDARPKQIETHEDQHSAEHHREDVGVQSEPQCELITDSPVAFRAGNLVYGMGLDACEIRT